MSDNVKALISVLGSVSSELEVKEKQLTELRKMMCERIDDNNNLVQEITTLKKANHAMQLFIEEHVDEEKKKLIFKD